MYEIISNPRVQPEYSDEYETTMIIDLRRDDGETGDVWIMAGVPDYHQGSARAAGHQTGFEDVRVFGDSPDYWCPESFRPADDDYHVVVREILAAVRAVALQAHRERREVLAE